MSFTRLRPDTYCGSTADSTQLVTEIVSNAVDEHLIGNCTRIDISIADNNVVAVRDNGQGIIPNNPVDSTLSTTTLEQVYGEINSSGKYDKSDNAVYKVSTGAFGIGGSLSCFLSHWFIATTRRDGEFETIRFKEGKFESRESGKCDKRLHGVEVVFQPSEEFFDDAAPNAQKIKDSLFKITCICPNLLVRFNDEEMSNPNGLDDFLTSQVKDEIVSNRCLFKQEKERQSLDFGMTFVDSPSVNITCFCNYGLVESGTVVTAVKSCITRVFNKWGKEQGILKAKDKLLSGNAVQEGMELVFNLVSPQVRYDSQTKARVTSTADNAFINDVISVQLEVWLDNNPEDGKAIIEKALIARRAAEAAKKAREAVKQKASEKKEKVFKLPTKLTDCWTKDRSKAELLICEGLSAASGLVAARDSEFQAVYGVRGKMLSVLKTSPDKVMKNQEINNIVVALGLDYSPTTGKMKYNKNKLRYNKIIACADADFDGYAIENLLFNILWYLCPELVINGHVYSSVPPLFRVTTKKNEYVYLKDEKALDAYKKKNASKIKTISREKGLGEMDSDELSHALLDPATRNVIQLQVNDIDETDVLFKKLYGKSVEPRVKFILEHSEEARID